MDLECQPEAREDDENRMANRETLFEHFLTSIAKAGSMHRKVAVDRDEKRYGQITDSPSSPHVAGQP
jgi:uncharacterized protein YbcV (DUF1398 family)